MPSSRVTSSLWLIVLALVLHALAPSVAGAQTKPCDLLPGQPKLFTNSAGNSDCTGWYFIRQSRDGSGAVMENPGISLKVEVMSDPQAATAAVNRVGRQAWFRDVAFGDGGRENIEEANADQGDQDMSVWTGESDAGGYEVFFRCGRLFVTGSAEPSMGVAARNLVGELAGRLANERLCGAGNTTRATPPPNPPQSQPPAVPQSSGGRFSVSGDCVFSGKDLFCAAQAANPPGGVPLEQVRYMWYLDGVLQGSRSQTFQLAVVPPGASVVGVKAFTPDTTSTETLTIRIR
jgi:hypothetical protein